MESKSKMNSTYPNGSKKHTLCRNWEATGTCRFGDQCHFRHITAAGGSAHGAARGGAGMSIEGASWRGASKAVDADGGWRHVGPAKPARVAAGGGGSGARGGGGWTREEVAAHKARKENMRAIHSVADTVLTILQKNGGLTDESYDALLAAYDAGDKVKKAQILHELASYSLHEFIAPDTPFGAHVKTAFGVSTGAFGVATARDGYNMFSLAVWPKWKKAAIEGISRTEDDVYATVDALLMLGLNPFAIASKTRETVFDTLKISVEKGKISGATSAAIEKLILADFVGADVELYVRSIDVMYITERRADNYGLALWRWALNQPELCAALASRVVSEDMFVISSLQPRGRSLGYSSKFEALKAIVSNDALKHHNFERAMATRPADKPAMLTTLAGVYMDTIADVAPRVAEQVPGEAVPAGKVAFASLSILGSFAFDIAAVLPGGMPPAVYSALPLASRIAFAARGRDVEELARLRETADISSANKIKCELWMEEFGVKPAVAAAAAVVSPASTVTLNLGFDKVKEGSEVTFTASGCSFPAFDDAIYSIEHLAPKTDATALASAFCVDAICSISKDHMLAQLAPLGNHLIARGFITKAALTSALADEETIDGALEDSPRMGARVLAVLRALAA